MHPTRLLVPVTALAAATLLVTACSSSGGGSSSSSGAPASTSAAPATSSSSAAAPTAATSATSAATSGSAPTLAQLQAIVLQPADLPTTFKAQKAEPDTGDDSLDAQLQACTGVKSAPDADMVATTQSDDFVMGDLTISSDAQSWKSSADVTANVAELKSPKINQCLNTAFKAEFSKDPETAGSVGSIDIRLTLGSSGGPSNVVAVAGGVVQITTQGKKIPLYLGVAFITGSQVTSTVSYLSINTQPTGTTLGQAAAAVAGRAAKS